jgi:plasmid maintenance system killer protein
MFMKFIMLLTLTTSFVFATEVDVSYGLMRFSLMTSKDNITFEDKVFKKDRCNQKIIEEFEKDLITAIKKMPIIKTSEAERVLVKTPGKESSLERRSPAGRYFLTLPETFRKLQIQNEIRCKKK